jgi:phosphate transport system substrate-binding protein
VAGWRGTYVAAQALTRRTDMVPGTALVKHLRTIAVFCCIAAYASPASAAEIRGAGSTFVYPLLSAWAKAYEQAGGASLDYRPIGSGGGIQRITNGTVAFGASDMPLLPADIEANRLVQFPLVSGAVVPILNLPGVGPGEITLNGSTLAEIFLGRVTRWNDPAIAKLNPAVTLPDTAITVVHRTDSSGTTFIWTDYLSKISREWANRVGENIVVDWPTGVGAKGNEGTADVVGRIAGALSYVEYAYAKQRKLSYAAMINRAGKPVQPTIGAFEAAAAATDWIAAPDFRVTMTDAAGDQSWPIAGSTFVLMQSAPADAVRSLAALQFFRWAYTNGKGIAAGLGYVPMPDPVVALIEDAWAQRIKGIDGKPVFSKQGSR